MKDLFTVTQRAHLEALAGARRAIRAGDLAKAERWMKLADLYWRNAKAASEEAREMRELSRSAAARRAKA